MKEEDKAVFKQSRPYVVGLVALLFATVWAGTPTDLAFDDAERFVKKFEQVNGIEA